MNRGKEKLYSQEFSRIKCLCGSLLGLYKGGRFHACCRRCKQFMDLEELLKRIEVLKKQLRYR